MRIRVFFINGSKVHPLLRFKRDRCEPVCKNLFSVIRGIAHRIVVFGAALTVFSLNE